MTRQRDGHGGHGGRDGYGGHRSRPHDSIDEQLMQLGGTAQHAGGRNAPLSPLEDLMKRKGIDEAWNALEEMQQQGISTDRFTISRMLMKTVGDGRTRWNPSKVYRGISLVEGFIRLQPEEADEVLFNALLDTCCRMKDLGRLEATVNRMRELQIHPSHVTLGILVKAYGQAGDVNKVLKVWDDMGEQRRQANAVTFGCMIDACVKCGHMEKAVEIFHDMKRRKKHRNTILYTTLIKGYGLEKDLQNALKLFKEMKDEGVPYNTITYNSIIDVCIKCSDVQTAEDLLRDMLAPGSNLEPDLITYSTLLKGYCHIGDLDRALQVAETIKQCGLKCDELVYNTLMDGCVKANDLSAGIGLFAEMTQAGMKPSSITHSILVRLYQRNGYKGDAIDAVAQLYQHHGLERPNATNERSGRGGGRRGKNEKNNHNNHFTGGDGGGHGLSDGFLPADGPGRRDAASRDALPAHMGGYPHDFGPPVHHPSANGGYGSGSYSQQHPAVYDPRSMLPYRERDLGPHGGPFAGDPYQYEALARGVVPMSGPRDLPPASGLYALPQQAPRGMLGSSAVSSSGWPMPVGGMGAYGDGLGPMDRPDLRYARNGRRPSFEHDGRGFEGAGLPPHGLPPWASPDFPYPVPPMAPGVLDGLPGQGTDPYFGRLAEGQPLPGLPCGGPGLHGEY